MMFCLEGIDGAGKTTQAGLLADRLCARQFKFPNKDTPTGKLIYSHLEEDWSCQPLWPGKPTIPPLCDALVFQALQLANRMEVAGTLDGLQKLGDHIVVDRYWPSGWVYGSIDGISPEYLLHLHSYLPQPEFFILLDVDASDSTARRPERRDRYERMPGFMEKVSRGYRQLWAQRRDEIPGDAKWLVVDARGPEDDVEKLILDALAENGVELPEQVRTGPTPAVTNLHIDVLARRTLALKASCDERTILKALRGEPIRGLAGARAREALKSAGYRVPE